MSILSSILLAPVKREFMKHICGVMRKCSYTNLAGSAIKKAHAGPINELTDLSKRH